MPASRALPLFFAFLLAAPAIARPGPPPLQPAPTLMPLRLPPVLTIEIRRALKHPHILPSRHRRTLALSLAPGATRILIKITAGALHEADALKALHSKTEAAAAYLTELGIDPRDIKPGKSSVAWYDFDTHKWTGHWATRHLAVIVPDLFDRPLFFYQIAKFGTVNPAHTIFRTRRAR